MAINTTFYPQNQISYESDKLQFFGQGVYGEASESSVTNIDYTLTDDVLLVGGYLLVANGKSEDRISFQVLAPDDTVIAEFISSFFINSSDEKQFDIALPYELSTPPPVKWALGTLCPTITST
jgi:hypothetical protein